MIIMVIAQADNSLGGSANQKVVISKDYRQRGNATCPSG